MIEVRDGRYFSRMFYAEASGHNVMGALFRDETQDGMWTLVYRFRYERDDKIFDSDDEKSWYTATMRGASEADALANFGKLIHLFRCVGNYRVEVLKIDSDRSDVVMAKLAKQRWVHMKQGA